MAKVFIYQPVGLDAWEHKGPEAGTKVVKVQPHGCPRNGTMGHAYIADAETGKFIGLRLLNSLQSSTPKRYQVGINTQRGFTRSQRHYWVVDTTTNLPEDDDFTNKKLAQEWANHLNENSSS
jgi:hypothetical protein